MPFLCRAHGVPLPILAAWGLECVFPIWFTQCGRVWFTLTMPCSDHAVLLKATAQHGRLSRAVLWPWEERRGHSMAWAWHGKCESDTAALCESNGKDTFWTLSGTAWQGNGIGAAWARHAMYESAFMSLPWDHTNLRSCDYTFYVIYWRKGSHLSFCCWHIFLNFCYHSWQNYIVKI